MTDAPLGRLKRLLRDRPPRYPPMMTFDGFKVYVKGGYLPDMYQGDAQTISINGQLVPPALIERGWIEVLKDGTVR